MTAFSEISRTISHGTHTLMLQYHHQRQSEIYAFHVGSEEEEWGRVETGSKGRKSAEHAQGIVVEKWQGLWSMKPVRWSSGKG